MLNERTQGDDSVNTSLGEDEISIGIAIAASLFDHSRDLLVMVNYFADQMPRPIIGIADSMDCAELHVLLASPTLDKLIDLQS